MKNNQPWRCAAVRDLAAALSEPSLMIPSASMPCLSNDFFAQVYAEAKDWLLHLDENPQPLLDHIAATPRHNRLGLYYEALLTFWMKENARWGFLAHDLTVFKDKRTVGAFDLLAQNPGGVMHLEVAVKYYLGVVGAPDWVDWIGPGQNDCLGLKMEKMLSKQLKLSDTPAGKNALRDAGFDVPNQKRLWLKGMYFRPYRSDPNCRPKQGMAARGIWLTFSAMGDLIAQMPTARWIPRDKPNWLAQLVAPEPFEHGYESGQAREQIQKQWQANDMQPVMWSLMMSSQNFWREKRRVFVVPDEWPSTARNISWDNKKLSQNDNPT